MRLVQIELAPAGAENLGLAAHAVHEQLRRSDGHEVRSLALDRTPERTQFWLGQVAVMCGGRHLDHAAQWQCGIHLHEQFLDGVVVDLLDDGPHALGGLRGLAARFDDLQHISGSHRVQRLGTDGGPHEALKPGLDLLAVSRRLGQQPFSNPALGERFEFIAGRLRFGHPHLPVGQLLASRIERIDTALQQGTQFEMPVTSIGYP